MKQFPQARVEGKGVTCPLHQCHTCLAGNLKSSAKATHGKSLLLALKHVIKSSFGLSIHHLPFTTEVNF